MTVPDWTVAIGVIVLIVAAAVGIALYLRK